MNSQHEHAEKRGKGLSTAAADESCDCPERVSLGTRWVEDTVEGGRKYER